MEDRIKKIFDCLEGFPFSVHDEKKVQLEMEELFQEGGVSFSREHSLKPLGTIEEPH